jgi:hypothetical protein
LSGADLAKGARSLTRPPVSVGLFPLAPERQEIACTNHAVETSTPQETVMKRLAFVAAVLAITACSKSENAAKDTTTPAMAPAPAPAATDSAAKMDSAMKADSARKADSAAKAAKKP